MFYSLFLIRKKNKEKRIYFNLSQPSPAREGFKAAVIGFTLSIHKELKGLKENNCFLRTLIVLHGKNLSAYIEPLSNTGITQ